MNRTWGNNVLAWVTRVLAVLFVVLNTYGWWNESQARQELTLNGDGSPDWIWQWSVTTHLLPLLLILAAAIVGWRMPLYGAIGFVVFAGIQAVSVGTEWVYLPLVVGPPLLIAVLFWVGWFRARHNSRNVT
mgnify:CR=1 FL=1